MIALTGGNFGYFVGVGGVIFTMVFYELSNTGEVELRICV